MTLHGRAEAIEQEAAEWFARRMGGVATNEEGREFASWLAVSTAHRIAYLRLETAWRQSERLKELLPHNPRGLVEPPAAEQMHPTGHAKGGTAFSSRKRVWPWGIAASLIVFTSTWMLLKTRGETYSTVVGQTRSLSMSDGTVVTMDTDTRIKIDDRPGHRTVLFCAGKALFNVVHDDLRPFSVDIADFQVVDIGTRFLVSLTGDETRLSVLEGRIRIRQRGMSDSSKSREIAAGNQVVIRNSELDESTLSGEEVFRQVSWIDGYIEFKDTALADAVREFNRYHARKMVINDPRLKDLRLGGRFRYSDLAGFLALLQRGFGIAAVDEGDQIKLSLR